MHEINVIGTMNLFAAASAPGSTVRNVVVKSSTLVYGCRPEGPGVVHRGDAAARSRRRPMVERSLARGRGLRARLRRDNPHVIVSLLRFSNVLGADIVTPLAKALRAAGGARRSSASTRASSSCTRTTSCGRSCSCSSNSVPGIYNVAGDGLLPWSEVARICGKRTVPLPPFGTGALSCAAHAASGRRPARPSCSTCCATAAASTTAGSSDAGFEYQLHVGRRGRAFVEALRLRATVGEQRARRTSYERDVEQFFRQRDAVEGAGGSVLKHTGDGMVF